MFFAVPNNPRQCAAARREPIAPALLPDAEFFRRQKGVERCAAWQIAGGLFHAPPCFANSAAAKAVKA